MGIFHNLVLSVFLVLKYVYYKYENGTIIAIFLLLEKEVLHFHFVLGHSNYTAGPGSLRVLG